MKITLKNVVNRMVVMTMLFMGTAVMFSCSKKDDQPIVPNETAVMKVSVAGIFGDDILVNQSEGIKIGSTKARSVNAVTKTTDAETVKLPAFDIVTSFTQDSYGDAPIAKSASIAKGTRANVPMGIGKKYRLLLYKDNGQFNKSVELTAGTLASIPVVAGAKYTWIAYSYNTDESLADVTNTSNPTIPTSVSKELLYATGQITISSVIGANDLLPITFKRKLGRVAVEIDAAGMFATDITQAKISFEENYFKEGTFNLKTGITSNFTAPVITTTLTGTAPAANVRTVYYYTADTATLIANLKVRLQSIKLKNDRAVETDYPVNAVFSYTNNNAGFTPAAGVSHKAVLDIVQGGVPMGSTIWATANLYYDATAPAGYRYKFRSEPSNIYNTTTNVAEMNKEYWQWMPDGLVPYSASYQPTNSGPHKDPCREVYPAGRWRMPTRQEFDNLVAVSSEVGGLNSAARNRYVTFTAAGKSVTFPSLGYRSHGNSSIIDWDLHSPYKAKGYYWSSTPETSNDAYYLQMEQHLSSASDINVQVTENIDVNHGVTVRCVRN
ncbi:FISUMP domain-containing protein [Sphingobacterium detergens]|uniref:Uncharacterized protein (TIGR02145 family) n=1 Tax=Sphingobacterium detergens TaxID=1145106 RepID=A0A420B6P4_SPHD1|nr:FISUMP domain-containing protein [Sphingobacterium detergens]RKE52318.1 uncharacterized protein (TIGR02145 family) [Sphingobacterium detergens]